MKNFWKRSLAFAFAWASMGNSFAQAIVNGQKNDG